LRADGLRADGLRADGLRADGLGACGDGVEKRPIIRSSAWESMTIPPKIAAIDTTTAKISKGVCAPTRSLRRKRPNSEPDMTLIASIEPTAAPSAPVCYALWATITPPIAATASP
jgi:hypothetical protein